MHVEDFLIFASLSSVVPSIIYFRSNLNVLCIREGFHGQDLMVVVGFSGSLAVFWRLFFLMFYLNTMYCFYPKWWWWFKNTRHSQNYKNIKWYYMTDTGFNQKPKNLLNICTVCMLFLILLFIVAVVVIITQSDIFKRELLWNICI